MLSEVKEVAMKVADKVEAASARAKTMEAQRDIVEAYKSVVKAKKDAKVAQKRWLRLKVLN